MAAIRLRACRGLQELSSSRGFRPCFITCLVSRVSAAVSLISAASASSGRLSCCRSRASKDSKMENFSSLVGKMVPLCDALSDDLREERFDREIKKIYSKIEKEEIKLAKKYTIFFQVLQGMVP